MENKKVPELIAETKWLELKRNSRLRKQDLIDLISDVLDHPVLEIDASLLTSTTDVLVRPRVEVNEQRRREMKGDARIEKWVGGNPKSYPKNQSIKKEENLKS